MLFSFFLQKHCKTAYFFTHLIEEMKSTTEKINVKPMVPFLQFSFIEEINIELFGFIKISWYIDEKMVFL